MLTKTPVLTLGAEPFGSRIQCWQVLIRMGPKEEMMFGTKQATVQKQTVQQNATETKWKWVKSVAETAETMGTYGNSWNLTAAYCGMSGMSGIAGSSQADKPRLGRVVLWRRLDFSHIPDWAQSLRAWWAWWAHGCHGCRLSKRVQIATRPSHLVVLSRVETTKLIQNPKTT